MDQIQPEPTFDESVKQVMKTLPPVIRTYLAQEKYTAVAKSLMTKYGLRIDQGGVLEREIMLLLMGIDNPDEFMQSLAEEAKLDQKIITSIVQDINTQIFVPLREEEMKTSQPAKPVFPTGLPQGSSPSAPEPKKYLHLDNRIPPRPAQSLRPSVSVATPVPPRFVVSPRVVPQGSSAPQNDLAAIHHQPLVTPATPPPSPKAMERQGSQTSLPAKPIANEKLLEDHEEPHIEFNKAPGSLVETPLRQALRTVIPPANLPGTFQSRPTPVEVRPSPKPSVPAAPAKPYSGDPYREPIEP